MSTNINLQMEKQLKYFDDDYELFVSSYQSALVFRLSTHYGKKSFKSVYYHDDLPKSLKKAFNSTKQLFQFFKHQSNFSVNADEASIVIHLKQIQNDEIVDVPVYIYIHEQSVKKQERMSPNKKINVQREKIQMKENKGKDEIRYEYLVQEIVKLKGQIGEVKESLMKKDKNNSFIMNESVMSMSRMDIRQNKSALQDKEDPLFANNPQARLELQRIQLFKEEKIQIQAQLYTKILEEIDKFRAQIREENTNAMNELRRVNDEQFMEIRQIGEIINHQHRNNIRQYNIISDEMKQLGLKLQIEAQQLYQIGQDCLQLKKKVREYIQYKLNNDIEEKNKQNHKNYSFIKPKEFIDKVHTNMDKFKIKKDNIIQYTGENSYKTKIFFNSLNSKDNVVVRYVNKIKAMWNKTIKIGILNKHINRYNSQIYCISYQANKSLSYGLVNGQLHSFHTGNGFRQGDVVIMEIDTNQNKITWTVGRQVRAQFKIPHQQFTKEIIPFVEMYNKGDTIQCQLQ